MKMSNFTLVNVVNQLKMYADKKLPQRISYAITRNLMGLSKDAEVYETQLNKIFENYKKYMVVNKDGMCAIGKNGIPIVDKSVSAEFNEQIAELLKIELDVDIYIINSSYFDYDDDSRYDALSAGDIMALQSILCDFKKEKESME